MISNKEHIDFDLIEKYFSGKMTSEEMNSFEKEALNDPFLYEAMQGFEANPKALQKLNSQIRNQREANKSFFGSRTIAIIGVAVIAYVFALVINEYKGNSQTNTHIISTSDSIITKEIEVIRENIDTLLYAEQIEQNSPSEIGNNQILIQEKQIAKIDSLNKIEQIDFVEPVHHDPELEIIEEQQKHGLIPAAPFLYMYDLYVVDFRELDRFKRKISYTRFELSGLSADFESEDTKSNTDLIEKKVEIAYHEYLKKSMLLFSKNDFKKALNRYLTILEQYPDDLNALFYGAHCYFNLREYDKALELFDLELKHEKSSGLLAFIEEAQWYKSKTLIKLGKIQEAKTLLTSIIAMGQFYSVEAISLRKNL